MVVREMNRRCNYDVHELELVQNNIRKDPRFISGNLAKINWNEFASLSAISRGMNGYPRGNTLGSNELLRIDNLITRVLEQSKPFELVCIHDEFKAHANNMNTVRYWYKEILAELADSHIMQSILRQIYRNAKLTLTRSSENLGKLIRESNYGIA